MHKFLRAIGFSEPMTRAGQQALINEVLLQPDYRGYTTKSNKDDIESKDSDVLLAEFRMDFANGCGVSVCGEFDGADHFTYDYFYPYLYGSRISTMEDVTVEQRIFNGSYAGVCDDMRVGVTLIFHLQNMIDYVKLRNSGNLSATGASVSLSALSTQGKIMMPIQKTDRERQVRKNKNVQRVKLLNAARTGDENAMENLTMKDMDTYAVISRKIHQEDVFSLVDSYFMPYGVECDMYSVLGEIKAFRIVRNRLTEEEICIMQIDCNDLPFDLCINTRDLYGEPAVGRRFKGVIWMQGEINFPQLSEEKK